MKGWETVNRIKVMLGDKANVSEVARRLKVDRKTVRKYRDMTMEEVAEYRGRSQKRKRNLEPFEKFVEQRIEQMAEDGVINSQAIYEELKRMGYSGSARSLRRFVSSRRRQALKKRIYQPFETPPGRQALVDLSEKRGVRLGGLRQTVYLVVMVLGFSRKKYLEWYDRPVDTEMFLQFHQRAFEVFEGIPHQIVYDQTKLAVLRERYGELEFNESFHRFAHWSGFETYICKKFDPESKGKVEAAVRYCKRSFLPGRRFEDLGDLERQSEQWIEQVANAKPHEITGHPPEQAWQKERPHLKPLQDSPWRGEPAFRIQKAGGDGLVKVLGNRYSVPSSQHGQRVKVRIGEEKIEIRTQQGEHLYSHWRGGGRGKTFKVAEHYRKVYSVPTQELTRRMLEVIDSPELVEELKRRFPRHYREQCRQILALAKKVDRQLLREAGRRLLEHHCVSYGNLKKTAANLESVNHLQQVGEQIHQQALELPADLGVEVRPAAYYDQLFEEVSR